MTAARAIRRGVYDFQSGVAFIKCPYPPLDEPTHHMVQQAGKPPQRVRIAIDYRQQWEIGWNVGEMLHLQHNKEAPWNQFHDDPE